MCVCVHEFVCKRTTNWATPPTLGLRKFSKVELIPLTVQVPVPSRQTKAGPWELGWPRPPRSGVRQAVVVYLGSGRPQAKLPTPFSSRGWPQVSPATGRGGSARGTDSGAQPGTATRFLPGKGPTAGNSSPAAACLDFYYRGFGEETTNNPGPLFLCSGFEMSHSPTSGVVIPSPGEAPRRQKDVRSSKASLNYTVRIDPKEPVGMR